MSEILVNTIKKADGTGSITVPSETGTVLTSASDIPAARLTGSLPAIDGSALTGIAGGVTSLNGQTGDITNTTQWAIGSYVTGRPANTTNYYTNDTLSGSSIYNVPAGLCWWSSGGRFTPPNLGENYQPLATLATGTWRLQTNANNIYGTYYSAGLWVRIS